MTNYGLFVGVDEYSSPNLGKLSGCVNDAVQMYKLLTNEQTGLIKSDDAVQFLNEQVRKLDIIEWINEAVSKLKKDETLTISWSSHGTRPKNDRKELYLITYDTVYKETGEL